MMSVVNSSKSDYMQKISIHTIKTNASIALLARARVSKKGTIKIGFISISFKRLPLHCSMLCYARLTQFFVGLMELE